MWQQSLKKTAQDSRRLRCPNKELVTGIFRLNYVIKGHARIFHLGSLTPPALFREHCLKDSSTSSAFSTSYFLNTSVFLFSCSILHSSLDSVIMIPTGNNSHETSCIKNWRIKRQKYPLPVMNRMIVNLSYAFYIGSISAVSRVRSLILPRGMSAGSFSRTAAGNRAYVLYRSWQVTWLT